MFVGRMPQDMTKEDLYNYFSKYGEVTDVYIPKPYRCFGFVTFLRSDVASVVASEDHFYKVIFIVDIPLRASTFAKFCASAAVYWTQGYARSKH